MKVESRKKVKEKGKECRKRLRMVLKAFEEIRRINM